MIADVDYSQKVVSALALSESGSCSRVGNSAQRLAFKRRPVDLGSVTYKRLSTTTAVLCICWFQWCGWGRNVLEWVEVKTNSKMFVG